MITKEKLNKLYQKADFAMTVAWLTNNGTLVMELQNNKLYRVCLRCKHVSYSAEALSLFDALNDIVTKIKGGDND